MLLAQLTGWIAANVFVVYLYLLITASLAIAWRLLGADPDLPQVARRGVLILAAVTLTVCPGEQFGQREHFMLVLALPYLLLLVLRARGCRVPLAAALAIGMAGGLGFAIKPHFLLVPLALEIYRLAVARHWRSVLRAEILSLAGVLVAYAALVAWLAPDYLARIVPYALEVYNQAYQNPLPAVLWRIETVMLPLGCLAQLGTRRNQTVPQLGDVFMIAAAAFFLAYVAQMKGWSYHLYPASSCLILGYGALVLNRLMAVGKTPASPDSSSLTPGIAVVSVVVIAILAGNAAVHLGYKKRFAYIMAPYVERYARDGSIAVLGSNVAAGFPLVTLTGVGWASRFPTLWLLPGVIQERAQGETADPALLDDIESYSREAVIADLSAHVPDVVIVDDRESKDYFGAVPFDYLAYFGQDPRFARIWSDYVWIGEEVGFDVYRRRCAPGCRTAPAAAP